MDAQNLAGAMGNDAMIIIGVLAVLLVISYIIIINLYMKVNHMQKRYHKMMAGVDGANLERMLIGYIDETKAVAAENERLKERNEEISQLLGRAITRVGAIRFRAFDNVGSDLSYAVALLDSHNDGVVLSSIFSRQDSHNYLKPIKDGQSSYVLSSEEAQALHTAMGVKG